MRSSLSFDRATKTSLAPFLKSNLAVAKPTPADAPVTKATLPLTSIQNTLKIRKRSLY